jgi:hypothetical protein
VNGACLLCVECSDLAEHFATGTLEGLVAEISQDTFTNESQMLNSLRPFNWPPSSWSARSTTRKRWPAALRDGRHLSPTELGKIQERIAADRRDLERFTQRVRQLRAQQRTH